MSVACHSLRSGGERSDNNDVVNFMSRENSPEAEIQVNSSYKFRQVHNLSQRHCNKNRIQAHSKLNLSQTILGQDYDEGEVDEDEAHDALYNSKLLMRVLNKYSNAYSQRLDIIVDTHMKDAEDIRRGVKYHLSTAKSRRKRLEQTEFYTFFGWEE